MHSRSGTALVLCSRHYVWQMDLDRPWPEAVCSVCAATLGGVSCGGTIPTQLAMTLGALCALTTFLLHRYPSVSVPFTEETQLLHYALRLLAR